MFISVLQIHVEIHFTVRNNTGILGSIFFFSVSQVIDKILQLSVYYRFKL